MAAAHCPSCDKPYADRTGRDPCPRCGAENPAIALELEARLRAERELLAAKAAAEKKAEDERRRTASEAAAAASKADMKRLEDERVAARQRELAQERQARGAGASSDELKECPNCAEAAKQRARVCPWCGYSFTTGTAFPAMRAIAAASVFFGICLGLIGLFIFWPLALLGGTIFITGLLLIYATSSLGS